MFTKIFRCYFWRSFIHRKLKQLRKIKKVEVEENWDHKFDGMGEMSPQLKSLGQSSSKGERTASCVFLAEILQELVNLTTHSQRRRGRRVLGLPSRALANKVKSGPFMRLLQLITSNWSQFATLKILGMMLIFFCLFSTNRKTKSGLLDIFWNSWLNILSLPLRCAALRNVPFKPSFSKTIDMGPQQMCWWDSEVWDSSHFFDLNIQCDIHSTIHYSENWI